MNWKKWWADLRGVHEVLTMEPGQRIWSLPMVPQKKESHNYAPGEIIQYDPHSVAHLRRMQQMQQMQ